MKEKFYILSFVLIIFNMIGYSQSIEWGYKIGGSYTDKVYDVVKDSLGNIYMTGGISNSVDFNPNGTPYILNAIGENSNDIFVAKYNTEFNLIWAFVLGSSSWDNASKLLLDDSLNVYVTGRCYGNVDFDPTEEEFYYNCSPTNAFIAKYGKEGTLKEVNGIPYIDFYSTNSVIYTDNQKNIYSYSNDTLCKFNTNLELIWRNRIEGKPELFDKSFFYSIQNFKTPFYSTNYDQNNLVLEKHDNISGDIIYSKEIAICSYFISGGFIKKYKTDKIIISGKFWGDMSFCGINDTITVSNSDMGWEAGEEVPLQREFIAMYDTLQNLIWAKAYDNESPEPYIIETDKNGNIYTLGSLNFNANFDPDGQVILTNAGYSNFIAKYNSDFNYRAASIFLGGSYNDFIGGFKLYGDTALICGHFYNTIDLDLTSSYFTLTSDPPEDIFIAKHSNFNITTNPAFINDNKNDLLKVNVFPNPSNGIFYLNLNIASNSTFIRVFDINGNIILSKNTKKSFEKIDLSNYPASIYFLYIKIGNSTTSKKIIITN